jgi:Ni/Co efflux regulator RcnB
VTAKPEGCLQEFTMKTIAATLLMLSITVAGAAHADGHDRHRDPNRGDYHDRSHEPSRGAEHGSHEPRHDWQRHDYSARNWNDRNSHRDWYDHAPVRAPDHWDRGPAHWNHDYRAYESRLQYRSYSSGYYRPYGYAPRVWRHGDYLPRAYCAPRYIVDYRPYRLSPPPYGYGWVRVDHDIFLTAIATGLVVSAVYDIFD